MHQHQQAIDDLRRVGEECWKKGSGGENRGWGWDERCQHLCTLADLIERNSPKAKTYLLNGMHVREYLREYIPKSALELVGY